MLEGEGLIDNAARRGAAFLEGMKALARRFPDTLVEVRGRGLMIGLEFVSAGAAARFRQGLLSRRVIVSTCGPEGGVVRLAPPLIVDEEQTDRFLAAASDALATLAPIPLQGRVSPT